MATKRSATAKKTAANEPSVKKTSTQKAFEDAAEIAPLVQTHKSNGGNVVDEKRLKKQLNF